MINVNASTPHLNFGPIGFYVYGRDFYRYARKARKPRGRYSPVPYFLYCQSLELLLKAWLAAHGVTTLKLSQKDMGHNLANLLKACQSHGLSDFVRVTEQRRINTRLASDYYNPGKKFNYADIGLAMRAYPNLPDLIVIRRFIESIIERTYDTVIRASNPSGKAPA